MYGKLILKYIKVVLTSMADTTKVKNSIDNLAKSSYNEGKRDGAKESRDPRRKKLGRSVDTVSKARENGKEFTIKQVKSAFNSLDDDRENFAKAKSLVEKAMGYFDMLVVPEAKPKSKPQPSSDSAQAEEIEN